MDILQKHFKKDHVNMRLWTRFYGMKLSYKRGVINERYPHSPYEIKLTESNKVRGIKNGVQLDIPKVRYSEHTNFVYLEVH